MNYTTRNKGLQRLDRETGMWLNYQLKRADKTHDDIAAMAGVERATVTRVLSGTRSNLSVCNALCMALGFNSVSSLLNAAHRSVA